MLGQNFLKKDIRFIFDSSTYNYKRTQISSKFYNSSSNSMELYLKLEETQIFDQISKKRKKSYSLYQFTFEVNLQLQEETRIKIL